MSRLGDSPFHDGSPAHAPVLLHLGSLSEREPWHLTSGTVRMGQLGPMPAHFRLHALPPVPTTLLAVIPCVFSRTSGTFSVLAYHEKRAPLP